MDPVVYLAHTAHVMLIANLWVEVGLVNGALGTAVSICYQDGGPPNLPVAVMVQFDHYTGPTLPDQSLQYSILGQMKVLIAHGYKYL